MAKGVLFDVAARIIEKAGHLAGQEIGQLWGVKDEIVKLRETVSTVKAMLLDAEKKEKQSNIVKEYLETLEDALYEADDLLDDVSTEALRLDVMTRNKKAKEVRIFFSKSNQLAYGLKMGHKVKAMRERLDDIARDMKLFHFEERLVETQVKIRAREQTLYFECAKNIVGRQKEEEDILHLLLDPNVEENVSIISILGVGGVGKTTLAQLVFNRKEIEEHFEQKLWVCISDKFDVKIIVQNILASAKNKKQENLEMNTLMNDFKKEIRGKRYLLVLDNLWNEDPVKWLNLKHILVTGGARGSKVLVTTRSASVAKNVRSSSILFLTHLSDNDSWLLFRHMAFENGLEPVNSNVGEIGRNIVLECKGLPLFTKTIGGLLYFSRSENEWQFLLNELSNLEIGRNGFPPILMLSYVHLPSYLKQCFTYCCLFPKSYKFHKPALIQMWIAQEFIRSLDQNLEDVGHEYFMELLWRSFFQEVEKDERGNILHFKIHDFMHDLGIMVARSDRTTFYSNVEDINKNALHELESSLQSQISLFKANRIRSFLLPSHPDNPCTRLDKSTYNAIVTSFKSIRLLDLHNLGIETIPSSLGKLKHLRYLDLSYNEHIKTLPNSITRLQNLQTLKLTACTQLKALPRDITKLVNLIYLDISGCMQLTLMPHGLELLPNLRIVRQSVVGKDLRENIQIELLHGEDAALESKVANLKEKQYLQVLEMHWIEDEVDEGDVSDEKTLEALQPHPSLEVLSLYRYWGVSFPTWLPSLTILVEFALFGCKKCRHLPPLDQFPKLKVLELDSLLGLECISKRDSNEEFSNSSFFPSLEELKLKYCPKLKGWWQRKAENHLLPTFPRLSKLCIRGCLNLTSMPLFPYLEKLELYYCSFKPLEQTTQIAIAATTIASKSSSSSSSTISNSSFTPFSELTSLEIGRMKEPLPEEFTQNLISLNHLLIYECRGPLIQGIRYLTTLKILDICSSEVFDLPNDVNETEWQGLRKLKFLSLFQHLELESLPVGLQHVTSLQKLMLDYCPNLNTIPEWICNLKSLRLLQILQCPKLKSLPEGICSLTSLQTLEISKCFNLTLFPKQMGGLASLEELYISEVPNLISLPEGIHSLTSLCILDISKWPNLTSLPEWMGGLACLETLYISECPNLASLPKGMHGLSSLKTLCIEDCPILLKRCNRETGEDWHKISHIPNLLRDRQGRNLDEESNETPKKPAPKNWSLIKIFGCDKF